MYLSAKKLAILLCILTVSVVGIVYAAVNLTNSSFINPRTGEADQSRADKVTIFGNGMTFISYEENVTLDDANHKIQFYLPYGALTDTLTLSGIRVVKITTSEEQHPIIARGDVITVYTEDAVHTGKFLG